VKSKTEYALKKEARALAAARGHHITNFYPNASLQWIGKCTNGCGHLVIVTKVISGTALKQQCPGKPRRAQGRRQMFRLKVITHTDHPMYESWKNICPNCRCINAVHQSGETEAETIMRCRVCETQFTFQQAFEKEGNRIGGTIG